MYFKFVQASLRKLANKFVRKKPSNKSEAKHERSYRADKQQSKKTENVDRDRSPKKTGQSNKEHSAHSSSAKEETKSAKHTSAHEAAYARKPRGRAQPSSTENAVQANRKFYVSPAGSISTSDAFLGANCTPQMPKDFEADTFIELGIDFGTKYTKVCFRDEDSEHTEIVTFTNKKSSIGQALILSKIEVSERNEVFVGLTEDEWNRKTHSAKETIDLLKMRLAYIDAPASEKDWISPVIGFETDLEVENLCAYFLSSVIVRSQNWLRTQHPILFKNRSVGWILNIGAPVAYWEGPTTSRFEQVLKMAWVLSRTPLISSSSRLTLEQFTCCVDNARKWINQNKRYPFDVCVKPEIAAAVWSYIQATGSSEGFFIFVDIGDGTAEGASFRYYRKQGEAKIDFYAGLVKSLGVSALSKKLGRELQLSENIVRTQLLNATEYLDNPKVSRSQTRKSFQQLVATTVVDGCEKHAEIRQCLSSDDIGSHLQIFVGGGGASIPFYPSTVKATHGEFNHGSIHVPPYLLKAVPQPKALEMNKLNGDVFNRFAIAYGLSMPEGEFPSFDFPTQDDSGSTISNNRPTRYEDSKDFC